MQLFNIHFEKVFKF